MAEEQASEIPASMDVHEAAEAMAKANLFGEPTKRPKDPATGKFVKATPAEEAPVEEAEEVAEEPEEPEEEQTEAEEQAEEKRKLKVKLDGMEQDVDEEEVVKGYLRQSDYTKKTQELAETRKRFEAEELSAVRQERQEYAQRLTSLSEALEALAPSREPDWEALARELQPEEFGKQFTSWKANRDRIARIEQEHARVRELQQQDEERTRATRLRDEKEKLEAAIPDLKDPEKGKVLQADLLAFAKSLGFSDDDVDGIEDHRALVILNESRLWRESQKRRPTVEAKVEKALESLKPSGTKAPPKAKAAAQAKARFMQDPSVENAAEAMRAAKLFG